MMCARRRWGGEGREAKKKNEKKKRKEREELNRRKMSALDVRRPVSKKNVILFALFPKSTTRHVVESRIFPSWHSTAIWDARRSVANIPRARDCVVSNPYPRLMTVGLFGEELQKAYTCTRLVSAVYIYARTYIRSAINNINSLRQRRQIYVDDAVEQYLPTRYLMKIYMKHFFPSTLHASWSRGFSPPIDFRQRRDEAAHWLVSVVIYTAARTLLMKESELAM